MATRRTNNFFDAPPGPAAPAPARKPIAKPVEEEPDEASVPEVADLQSSMHRRSSRPSSAAVRSGQAGPPPLEPGAGMRPASPALGFLAPPGGQGATRSPMQAQGFLGGPRPSAYDSPGAGGNPEISRRMAGMSLGAEAREPDSVSEGMERPGLRPTRGLAGPAASPPPQQLQQPQRVGGGRRGGGAAASMVVEDLDDFENDFGDIGGGTGTGPSVRGRGQGVIKSIKSEPVPQQTMRAIQQLLWGAQGQPPPSWKQGFVFNAKHSLQFGLVQFQGGPCGVLAGVQAHILAALASTAGTIKVSPSSSEQQAAIVTGIAELLWQARSGPSASVALLPQHDSGARMSHDQLMRGATFVGVSQRHALEETLRSALPAYMEQNGWGVVLLLVSLMLTRGVHVVRSDMDEPTNALMGMHGYCTQELVNLILTGQAVSNVFDGERSLDGSVLKGIAQPSRLGLLTLFEWYKYVEVGSHLKCPQLPIWVVCSESHFTVLFAADARALRGVPPFDLLYYDELANQDDTIRLSIRKDPAGGWTARVGDSFGDRGKCEGRNIPPLECVIETRWPGVAVNWNGSEPIL